MPSCPRPVQLHASLCFLPPLSTIPVYSPSTPTSPSYLPPRLRSSPPRRPLCMKLSLADTDADSHSHSHSHSQSPSPQPCNHDSPLTPSSSSLQHARDRDRDPAEYDSVSNRGPTDEDAGDPGGQQPTGPPDWRLVAVGAVAALAVIGGGVAVGGGALNGDVLLDVAHWFESLGPNAVVLYAVLYFVLELFAVPATPLTLGSGYLFGVLRGTIAVSISSTLAAAAAFLISRYLLRDLVATVSSRYPRFRAMDSAIGREGFKFVLLLRLSPLLPFSISNYLYGLTSVDFWPFVVASWAGMLPGTLAYVSAGAAVGALSDLSDPSAAHISPALLVVGGVATVAALWLLGRLASQAVSAATTGGGNNDHAASDDPSV